MLWYTPGPASAGQEIPIIEAGATGVRLTFSFSTHEFQLGCATAHRTAASQLDLEFLVVADLGGEKFRLGQFETATTIEVKRGDQFTLACGHSTDPVGDRRLAVRNRHFFANIEPGDLVTVGDGSAVFSVGAVDIGAGTAHVVIETSGTINPSRGLTVQGASFRPQSLTEKDVDDLVFIAKSGAFDAVALSFVSSSDQVVAARKILAAHGSSIPIIAKVETASGVINVHEICDTADMVMAARGDLALAIQWVDLPGAVSQIAKAANVACCPWILGTQIVEGMERFVIPTRAEICDLAHWLGENCGGVLLSYETAFGANPVGAVQVTRLLIDRWAPTGRSVRSAR